MFLLMVLILLSVDPVQTLHGKRVYQIFHNDQQRHRGIFQKLHDFYAIGSIELNLIHERQPALKKAYASLVF